MVEFNINSVRVGVDNFIGELRVYLDYVKDTQV